MKAGEEDGTALPHLVGPVPGPKSVALVDRLALHESPGVTARRGRANEARGLNRDPIVWARSRGANVWDADGNRYLDLTSGFGVALIGHGHPRVVEAIGEQSGALLHAMGDVYPNPPRIALMERLAGLAPGDLSQCILTCGGAEAVEAALKTAAMKSGRPGVLAFEGSYHGLSYGALAVSHYRAAFRAPFLRQLGEHVTHRPYGERLDRLDALLEERSASPCPIGAILVEPILGRGGEVEPPAGWLPGLRALADQHEAVLIFDEIYTGLGRTGDWWAAEHEGVVRTTLVPFGARIVTLSRVAAERSSGVVDRDAGRRDCRRTPENARVGHKKLQNAHVSSASLATWKVSQANVRVKIEPRLVSRGFGYASAGELL